MIHAGDHNVEVAACWAICGLVIEFDDTYGNWNGEAKTFILYVMFAIWRLYSSLLKVLKYIL